MEHVMKNFWGRKVEKTWNRYFLLTASIQMEVRYELCSGERWMTERNWCLCQEIFDARRKIYSWKNLQKRMPFSIDFPLSLSGWREREQLLYGRSSLARYERHFSGGISKFAPIVLVHLESSSVLPFLGKSGFFAFSPIFWVVFFGSFVLRKQESWRKTTNMMNCSSSHVCIP